MLVLFLELGETRAHGVFAVAEQDYRRDPAGRIRLAQRCQQRLVHRGGAAGAEPINVFGRLAKDCSVTFSRSRRETSPVRVEAEPSISACMMPLSEAMRSPSIEPEVSSTKVVVPGWR